MSDVKTPIPQILHAAIPLTPEIIAALTAMGTPIAHVRHDTQTGEVFVSEDGTGFERADVWTREAITGVSARDAAEVDPLIPEAAQRDPILRTIHAAKARDMLLYITEYYRPDLRRHPRIKKAADHVVGQLAEYRPQLAALPTVYDRWDLLVDSFIDWLEELPRKRPSKARN